MSLLPAPFLFRYSIPVQRIDRLPRSKAPLLQIPQANEIPFPSTMEVESPFARLFMAWNPHGLAISVKVQGKSELPRCSLKDVRGSDGVQIWLDTRDTQNVHRATRYCHHFCLHPLGAEGGKGPVVKQFPIPRAGDDAPQSDEESILVESEFDQAGYHISAWFPKAALSGFDPEAYARLGFYICIQDRELGNQYLTVGEEFPYANDPSLWVSLQLVSES